MVNNDGGLRACLLPVQPSPAPRWRRTVEQLMRHPTSWVTWAWSHTKPGRCRAFADSEKSPVEHIVASKILAPPVRHPSDACGGQIPIEPGAPPLPTKRD